MKKILAVLLALSFIVLAFAGCGDKQTETPTEADTNAVEAVSDAAPAADATEADTAAVDATEPASEQASAAEDATAAESTTAAADATAAESTAAATQAAKKAPSTKAEILAAYNAAVNSAYDAKAAFNKERYCDNEVMDMSVALKPFKSLVEQFVDIGPDNRYTENVAKGKWDAEAKKHYLRKSTLTEADITNATIKENGGVYTIVLNVKDGSSTAGKDKKANNSPIDKCGICVGSEDKSYFDHKTALVIYDAIDDTYAGAKINEKYSGATVTATVDAATGHLTGMKVEYKISVDIDIGIGSGTATGNAHIIYKDVKY